MEGPNTLFNIAVFLFILLLIIFLAIFFSKQSSGVLSPITGINEQEIKDQMHTMPCDCEIKSAVLEKNGACLFIPA